MMQQANSATPIAPVRAVPEVMSKYIDRMLMMRGARDVTCRVYRPSAPGNPYPAMLEKGAVSEQFYLNYRDVDVFTRTGTEVSVSTEVRMALRNLDRRYQKKMAGRR